MPRRMARGRRSMASAPGDRSAAGGVVLTAPEPGSGPVLDGEALLARARRVIRSEADALLALEPRLGEPFLRAVEHVHAAAGRVIVRGLAKSGESSELTGLVDYLSRLGVPIVALTGRSDSTLARAATVVLDCSVAEEACPFDLAPTTSTTATLAMGDALAVALLLRRGFTREDFARLHPGGALGRKLTVRVRDVMLREDYPFMSVDGRMRECIVLLAEKRGTVPIIDGDRRVVGVVTAGDLTRLMESEEQIFEVPVSRVMNRNPKLTEPD